MNMWQREVAQELCNFPDKYRQNQGEQEKSIITTVLKIFRGYLNSEINKVYGFDVNLMNTQNDKQLFTLSAQREVDNYILVPEMLPEEHDLLSYKYFGKNIQTLPYYDSHHSNSLTTINSFQKKPLQATLIEDTCSSENQANYFLEQ
jgi:hypothetical protein